MTLSRGTALFKTMTEEQIKTVNNERIDAKTSYIEVLHHAQTVENNFLNVKLAFVAFISVIFTIVLGKDKLFSKNFIVLFSTINLLTFLLLLENFRTTFKSHAKSLIETERAAILANIRYICTLKIKESIQEQNKQKEQKFLKYGNATEQLNENSVTLIDDMEKGIEIEDILENRTNKHSWKFDFVIWGILIILIPIFFILSTLGML